MGRQRSSIEDLALRVLSAFSYVCQGAHCLVPAAVLNELVLDARIGVYKDIPNRVWGIAICAFFFVYLAHMRRCFPPTK